MSAPVPNLPPDQGDSLDRMAEADRYNAWLLDRSARFLGRRVLDFGAGIGTFTAALSSAAHVVAVEPDPALTQKLRKRFADDRSVSVIEAGDDWLTDPKARSNFETILCLNVLEHIEDDETVLHRFRDCLVTGGHVLLLVPAHQALFGEIDRKVGHKRRYSRLPLAELLKRAGLDPVEIRYVNPLGGLGWLVSSRILKREEVPIGPLRAYNRLVPLLRHLDDVPLPFGLSVWAVARKAK